MFISKYIIFVLLHGFEKVLITTIKIHYTFLENVEFKSKWLKNYYFLKHTKIKFLPLFLSIHNKESFNLHGMA